MVVHLTVAATACEPEHLPIRLGRIRDIRVDATGALYVLTDDGTLYRVEPAA